MKRYFLILVFLFLGCYPYYGHPPVETDKNAEKHFELGVECTNKKGLLCAIEEFSKSIEHHPYSATYANRATAYMELKMFDEAIEDIDRAIEMKSNIAGLLAIKGRILYKMGEDEKGLKLINKSIRIHPFDKRGYRIRADYYLYKRNYKAALKNISRAIKNDKEDYRSYLLRGVLNKRRKEYKKALKDFNKVLALKPDVPSALHHRASILIRESDQTRALEDINSAIKINPDFYKHYTLRAAIYVKLKKTEMALEDINKSIALKPNQNGAYFTRARIYKKQEKYDEALNDISKVIENYKSSYYAYNMRGNIYIKQEKWQKAYDDFCKSIDLNKNSSIAFNNRAYCCFKLGTNYEKALNDVNKALSIKKRPIYLDTRAELYNTLGRKHEAMQDYRDALILLDGKEPYTTEFKKRLKEILDTI